MLQGIRVITCDTLQLCVLFQKKSMQDIGAVHSKTPLQALEFGTLGYLPCLSLPVYVLDLPFCMLFYLVCSSLSLSRVYIPPLPCNVFIHPPGPGKNPVIYVYV